MGSSGPPHHHPHPTPKETTGLEKLRVNSIITQKKWLKKNSTKTELQLKKMKKNFDLVMSAGMWKTNSW